ncbi:MAG: ion transporter [Sumerlaeia bacterium]
MFKPTARRTVERGGPKRVVPTEDAPLRERVGHIIFTHDTRLARLFDVVLLWAILGSILAVILESVPGLRQRHGMLLLTIEWFFTALFSVEYGLRLWTARRRLRYARSFFGIVDLLSILPTYLSLLFPGAQSLLVIRSLRLLRVFRILKLGRFFSESRVLMEALRTSRPKITVFLMSVLTVVLIMGAAMYFIEGPENGFTSIPLSMYWAIVTLTTVGYGDISPQTPWGQALSSLVMLIGYAIIAIPTGIVSVELARADETDTRMGGIPVARIHRHAKHVRRLRRRHRHIGR